MRTATINKRPVNSFAIVLAALIGLALHFLAPLAALAQGIKRAQAKGRISYSSNRIVALQARLNSIDLAVKETRANGNDAAEITRLARMKAAACEEIAEEQVALAAAQAELTA
ncbi:hypothetical protein LVJ82_04670 [Vitreoscilla massiliensis]|uniref:Uncharacterized protein n=1 Tax=Vitreoscilla massiliensis TaxID=1689272 RepID=A0ABY4E5X1_9NEIS|nr:hypothetical protein [Vitreoscilla massiliensis]UOO90285.1 hypothetical protein LVJ82_04670 [Vitreoscilla massiliensis]